MAVVCSKLNQVITPILTTVPDMYPEYNKSK